MFVEKTRPLTDVEKKQLRINRVIFEDYANRKFDFVFPFIFLIVIIFSFLAFYLLENGWFLTITAFFIFLTWLIIDSFFKDKEGNRNKVKEIDYLLQGKEIDIIEVKCSRAIMFEDADDLGDYHILELNDGRLLYLNDITWSYSHAIPNTHFEIYVNEMLHTLFHKSINTLGTGFSRIQFSHMVTQRMLDNFLLNYEDGQIIHDFTFDEFLDKVEEMVRS